MRKFFYVLSAFAVMGLAFWAYHESYKTQKSLKTAAELQRQIGKQGEALAILRAEWAYLNRPNRLRELAEMNFDRLGLLPLTSDRFGRIDQVAFPIAQHLPITSPVDVSGLLDAPRSEASQ